MDDSDPIDYDPRSDDSPVPSRVRFEDPQKFLEFYEKQLSRGVVGLRHPQAIGLQAPMLVVVSPPGAPDRLVLPGRVSRVSQRPDGAWRLRVEIEQRPQDAAWLEGYVEGLRVQVARGPVGLEVLDVVPVPVSVPPAAAAPAAAAPELPRTASSGEIRELAERLDQIDYYDLLGVPEDVDAEILQNRFHFLTRRFHPDLFHGMDWRVVRGVNQIYRRMNEAYSVLKSPVRRRAYDAGRRADDADSLRLGTEALEEARRRELMQGGTTGPGDFYWGRARLVLESARGRQEWEVPARMEAARLLRTALFFEPENDHFRTALDQIERQLPRA
ncbi:MAG: J domain-containing protein [Myxococcales bacterium]|nr:J domain-containing protein [Myxococcales bacterium]